ncbi:ABC transporter substrate-binding protein [Acetobacter senegalensis]|uniref:ABC transporter substrate-binding protein n=1 Tax=Acetobacter senegalensis TaxID=446692 RepID=UPI001D03A0B9|nr:ABC transporter substrate-binding protein [Acetobacter senegalensis]
MRALPLSGSKNRRSFLLAGLLGTALAGAFLSPLSAHSAQARTVVDMSGTPVEIKDNPTAIADLWFAHNELLVMLGAADKIKVTAEKPSDRPWLFKIAPVLLKAETGVHPDTVNPEDLLARHIDLVIVPQRGQADALRKLGLPTLHAQYTTVPQMLQSIDMTAEALGTQQAREVAGVYRQKMDALTTLLHSQVAKLPAASRPRVLHIATLNPLQIDGQNTMIDTWIKAAGGENAATVSGNHRPTTFEQIATWNPDIVIVGPTVGELDASSPFRSLPAFQKGKWVRNPQGVFPWDRYGCEELLQLEWAAKLFHPAEFADLDMRQDLRNFYQTFFHYALTDDDITRILAAQPPASTP